MPVLVHRDICQFMVVEPSASQAGIADFEAQWGDQVELCSGVGTQANDVARVGRDLGLIQNYVQHGSGPAGSVIAYQTTAPSIRSLIRRILRGVMHFDTANDLYFEFLS